MNILVANLGSTSVKYQVLAMPQEEILARGRLERVTDFRKAVEQEVAKLPVSVDAVAFKTVHGGPEFCGTYLVDDQVLEALEEFRVAAPLHNRIYLDGIRAFQLALPDVPLVAAFETEFHRTRPPHASFYGIPAAWRERFGVRKYGFHGASHEYISQRAPEIVGVTANALRIVSCHLGGSSSICAIGYGKSIDCTMGFSPQSGIENATRPGDLDVYALLHLMNKFNLPLEKLLDSLTKDGGLAGLSGVAGGDMRDILQAMERGNTDAGHAFEVFAYEVKKCVGAYAAAMDGLDVVVFTGGIGENHFRLRSSVCLGLGFLGIELDEQLNVSAGGDRVISTRASHVKVMVIQANEELVVARRAAKALNSSAA